MGDDLQLVRLYNDDVPACCYTMDVGVSKSRQRLRPRWQATMNIARVRRVCLRLVSHAVVDAGAG